jgi:hypothetical protein
MIIKLALLNDLRSFLGTTAGKRTAIGAAIGATAGAIHRKDNRTHGASTGAVLGGLGGLAAHETGLTDLVKNNVSEGIKSFGKYFKKPVPKKKGWFERFAEKIPHDKGTKVKWD